MERVVLVILARAKPRAGRGLDIQEVYSVEMLPERHCIIHMSFLPNDYFCSFS
jgi:hypothetical protein